MYLAKVEAEAIERELQEAIKQQDKLENKQNESQGTTGVIGKVGNSRHRSMESLA